MIREDVKSSNIKSIGYDEDFKKLHVEFVGGRVYEYENVENSVFESLKGADSIGNFFYKNIRGVYNFKMIQFDESIPIKQASVELINNN